MDYERFTEFYILDQNGETTDYPHELKAGESGNVILGIINREQEITRYRIEVRINEIINTEIGDVVLDNNEKIEELLGFTPATPGDNQKVEFLLYKNGLTEPYNSLHLWITVIGKD